MALESLFRKTPVNRKRTEVLMRLFRVGQPMGQSGRPEGDNKMSDNWTPLLTHDKLGMIT